MNFFICSKKAATDLCDKRGKNLDQAYVFIV